MCKTTNTENQKRRKKRQSGHTRDTIECNGEKKRQKWKWDFFKLLWRMLFFCPRYALRFFLVYLYLFLSLSLSIYLTSKVRHQLQLRRQSRQIKIWMCAHSLNRFRMNPLPQSTTEIQKSIRFLEKRKKNWNVEICQPKEYQKKKKKHCNVCVCVCGDRCWVTNACAPACANDSTMCHFIHAFTFTFNCPVGTDDMVYLHGNRVAKL